MTEPVPLRGDVWLVDLGTPVGHEAGLRRPALVLSAHEFNTFGFATVAPITRTNKPYPSRVEISPGLSGLHQTSYIQVEHLRTISTLRLERRLGVIAQEMVKVERILRLLLEL